MPKLRIYPPGTRKGNKRWVVRGRILGVVVERTAEASGEAEARREARRIEREETRRIALRRDSDRHRERQGWTFVDAALAYIKAGGEARFLGEFDTDTGEWSPGLVKHFFARSLGGLTQSDLDEAAAALKPDSTPQARNRSVYTPFIAVYNHAAHAEQVPHRMWRRPRWRKVERTRWSEPEWFAAVLPHCNRNLQALLLFMAATGCRITEALELTPGRVVYPEQMAYIPTTKNGEPRGAWLPAAVVEAMQRCHPRYGRVFGYKSKRWIGRLVKDACEKAGVEYRTTHEFGRHTYATYMRRQGADARALSGPGQPWRDAKSVIRYQHVTAGEVARKADSFPLPSVGESVGTEIRGAKKASKTAR